MNKREIEIKKIVNELARWEAQISNLNSLNLYDANIFSEHTICVLLNTIYNYKLHNVNIVQKNFPAIDLGDQFNRVAFQVTSTKATKKIQNTVESFIAKGLAKDYDQLFVLILGRKQKSYPVFDTKQLLEFNNSRHIIDFHDLLNHISSLPTPKIEEIGKILTYEHPSVGAKAVRKQSSAAKLKRNLALRSKMKKKLQRTVHQSEWEHAAYEPWIRFKYHNIIVRNVEDRSFPEVRDTPAGQMSSWFKGEFWDFYENGLELISQGGSGEAIFDKHGNWDILHWNNDTRRDNPDYTVVHCNQFLRIPYDYIVSLDMEVDQYHGYPSLYVEYLKDGMPYEEIVYGQAGVYKLKQRTRYFDNNMREKLK
ncbi:SMEK domain-containing protein [Hymenobacter norwichensis]|uniref:SMEK domain-containing protein n=1 Tax=Hymenobacter norwichensis TaxID=223903 RepID=UPI0012F9EBF9|nr:SMEK domain-containing protein [Hymenobacter norwichensis]